MSDKPTTAELITMLREFDCHADVRNLAADRLEAAAPPKWTKITDDPDTWPEDGETVMLVKPDNMFPVWFEPIVRTWHGVQSHNKRSYWRPLCDLDYPPEQQ